MSLAKSEAVVLKTFNWAESSRTVVFFTREFGKFPLVDKGGRRIASRRGRLLPFARMELTFYKSEKEARGYVSDAELVELFSFEKEGTLGRLAYGSAACELLYLLLPDEEPQPALYEYFLTYLKQIDSADRRSLPALFLTWFLRLLSHLGYHPSLAYCVDCGKGVEDMDTTDSAGKNGRVNRAFSPERGGMICSACQQPGEYYIGLSSGGYDLLLRLQTASLAEAATMAIGYREAALLVDVLTKFLSYQSGIGSDLKSLEFLEKLKNSHLQDQQGSV